MHLSRTMALVAGLAGALPLLAAFGIAYVLAATPGSAPGRVALYGIAGGLVVLLAVLIVAAVAGKTIDLRRLRTQSPHKQRDVLDAGLVRRLARALAIEGGDPRGPALRRFLLFAMPPRPRPVPVYLNKAVDVCVRTLQETDPREAQRLTFDPDPNAETTNLDPDQFHQVLLNLIMNARQAAGPEGQVDIRTQVLDGSVLLAVRDDGPGLPSGQTETVFEPFHSKRPGALGVGLATCRQIVRAHGGSIVATNIPPHGLEVGVKLPLSRRFPPEGKRRVRLN